MKMSFKRSLTSVLALCLLSASLAACTQPADDGTTTSAPEETSTKTPDQIKLPDYDGDDTLVVGYSHFTGKFSPFFASSAYDQDVQAMTQIGLLGTDREGNVVTKGKNGQVIAYNGKDYTYNSLANVDIVTNTDGSLVYKFDMRNDVYFSDGVQLTADDAIFSMYVYSDPTYDGSSTFYALPIVGMKDYRTGISGDISKKYEDIAAKIFAAGRDHTWASVDSWTAEQQTAFWKNVDIAWKNHVNSIVEYAKANYASYLDAVNKNEIALGMYVWGYGSPDKEGGGFTDKAGKKYTLQGTDVPTLDDFFALAQAEYKNDVAAYYAVEVIGNEATDLVSAATTLFVIELGKTEMAGKTIDNIAGITKTGTFTFEVKLSSFDASAIYKLGFTVTPLHYYGNKAEYNYEQNKFGFTRGDLSSVRAKTGEPLGAGPYKFVSYKDGLVTFERNIYYYLGVPKITNLVFKETSDADKTTGVISGAFDITDPSFSKAVTDQIMAANTDTKGLTGNVVTTNTVDNLGYGYIGINANNIKVGEDKASEQSKALRTAFATMFSVYRDVVVNSYYGERATVIQYPISNTSWAAPKPADEGFAIAFSKDVDGKSIYTADMTEQQKYEAALKAAIAYFKKAGYTWDEASKKFTAAPAGAHMSYEFMIPAGGTADHPSYGIVNNAKNALESIGISIQITDLTNATVLWNTLEAGQGQMWAAAWGATVDPDMYQVYHSSNVAGLGGTDSNHYAIQDAELDKLIMDARVSPDQSYRKVAYKDALDIVIDWAVEVPTYQRQNAIIFSTERVKLDTLTPDITTFWT